MLRTLIFSIVFLFLSPLGAFATTTPLISAGIPKSQLWFSQDPFFAGEEITIYSLLYNSSPNEFVGTLALYDGKIPVGKKEFSITGNGGYSVLGFSWRATEGSHNFYAVIESKDIYSPEKILISVRVETATTSSVKRVAELDTDGDRIGNALDEDDDNDGLSDKKEKELGTDPKLSDTDGDGYPDGEDVHPLKKDAHVEATTTNTLVRVPPPEVSVRTPPAPLFSTSTPVVGKLEALRMGELRESGERVSVAREIILSDRARGEATTSLPMEDGNVEVIASGIESGHLAKSPFAYVKLLSFMAYDMLLSRPYFFYIVLLYILLRLVKMVVRMVKKP